MAESRPKVLIIVGTRPEAIKMLPLIKAFKASELTDPIVVSTGQHSAMVNEVLALGGIEADVDLHAGTPGNTLNELFASVLTKLEAYCLERFGPMLPNPSTMSNVPVGYPVACLVHGDTSSAAAGALAAFHMRIPVAHVEAGLRTSDTLSPFPEELNRQLISRIAMFHLAPTYRNRSNLVREGVPSSRVFVCGNTAIDALQWAASLEMPYDQPELADLETDTTTHVVVITAHRRENWGEPLQRIGVAIATLAHRYPDVRFVLPLHPNPNVQRSLRPLLEQIRNVSLVKPMAYTAFARLLQRAHLVITDSGGIQEEAPSLGTPVLVMRETTERQEGVDMGTVELVGSSTELIVSAASRLLDNPAMHAERAARPNPYGDGRTAERIVQACEYVAFDTPPPQPFGVSIERLEVLRSAGFLEDPSKRAAAMILLPE